MPDRPVRTTPDRRSQPRGGRRPADVDGQTPLVMVVGDHSGVSNVAEAVLAKLKFAVSPSRSVDDALRVLTTLRPDLILATADDAARLRREAPEHLAVLTVSDRMREDPEQLIEEIRKAIRANRAG
jgi:CheY-like chemotaxis protein